MTKKKKTSELFMVIERDKLDYLSIENDLKSAEHDAINYCDGTDGVLILKIVEIRATYYPEEPDAEIRNIRLDDWEEEL